MTETRQTDPPVPAMFGKAGAYVAGMVALLLAMNELSMLSAGFLDSAGKAWTFNDFLSWNVWDNREAWNAVLTADQLRQWQWMFWLFLALDVAFILTYWRALVPRFSGIMQRVLLALVAVDLVETVATGALLTQRCADGGCVDGRLINGLAVLTTVKWALVLGLLVILPFLCPWRRVGQVLRATYIQRYSLLAFLPIALLAVVPGTPITDMFDQLPDVQRQWLDNRTGIWHAAAAGLVHGLVLLPAIFLLGRIRADWAARRVAGNRRWPWFEQPDQNDRAKPRPHHLTLWLIGPLVLFGLAAYSQLRDPGSVVWLRLVAFCSVPLFVAAASWVLRRKCPPQPGLPRAVPLTYDNDVMAVGDVLTVAAASLAGLGTVRALTALAAMNLTEGAVLDAMLPAFLTVSGGALAVLAWPVGAWLLKHIDVGSRPGGGVLTGFSRVATPGVNVDSTRGVDGQPRTAARWALLVGAVGGFIGVSLLPRDLAGWFGALAVTVAALALIVVMVGVVVAYAQERQAGAVSAAGPWHRSAGHAGGAVVARCRAAG